MSMVPYIGARLVHALLAGTATAILLTRGMDFGLMTVVPAIAVTDIAQWAAPGGWWDVLTYSGISFFRVTGALGLGAAVIWLAFTLRSGIVYFHKRVH